MSVTGKILISLLLAGCSAIAVLGPVDSASLEYTDRGFRRTLVTYGVARALNGVISVAQGTELAVEPAGIGLNFAPGEILDPVNDLIERFSWVVLTAGTSLGMQRVLLEITASRSFTLVVSAALAGAILLVWWPVGRGTRMRDGFYRFVAVLLILRFAVPLAALASEGLYQAFLAPLYASSSEQLYRTSSDLTELSEQTGDGALAGAGEEPSFLDSAREGLRSVSRGINIRKQMDAFRDAAEAMSENAINLIVIFVLQTLLLPLLFLWLLVQLLKRVMFGDRGDGGS